MLNYEEIRGEIERLEHAPTTYANVEKLAMLYQVINNAPDRSAPAPAADHKYSYAPDSNSSEFIKTFNSAPIDPALQILDEHMTAVSILYPREYNAIIRKLKDLK